MAKVVTLRDTRPSGWSQDRWRWLHEVRQDGDLSAMARLVACSLGFGFANSKTGECRPGVQALARDVKVSPRTIERCLTDLQTRGWIVRLGGNAPGLRATFAFRFPGPHTPIRSGRHTSDLSERHTTDLSGTCANPDAPPRPPLMEQPNMNHSAPDISLVPVPPGSPAAERWDAWLLADDFPPLTEIGKTNFDGDYLMPVTTAPDKSDTIAYGIARRWVEYLLRSKA